MASEIAAVRTVMAPPAPGIAAKIKLRLLRLASRAARHRALHQPRPGVVSLVSFDVMETLLLRPYLSPDDLHETVGYELEALGWTIAHGAWRLARIAAEQRARAAHEPREITLAEIYRELSVRLSLSVEDAVLAMQLERETEARTLTPIAEMAAFLARCRSAGPVAFLSDMYLPQDDIGALLRRHAMMQDGDLLHVSSATGQRKHSGTLFDTVLSDLAHPAGAQLHIGDNPHSDFVVPLARGIKAQLYAGQALSRFEAAAPIDDRYLRSVVAGSARVTRLARHFDRPDQQTIWQSSASVAGPLLTGFVLWTLLEARRRGLDRLFYFARDGQVLVAIARALAARFCPEVTPCYFLTSRQALFLPALDPTAPDFAQVFARLSTGRRPAAVAASLEMPLTQLQSIAREGGLDLADDQALDAAAVARLAEALKNSAAESGLLATTQRRAAAAGAMFRDAGMFAGDKLGFVDIGWYGSLQAFLARALARIAPKSPEITGLYFGLWRDLPPGIGTAAMFHSDENQFSSELVELFCAADHGTVRHYDLDADGVPVAVLKSPRNDEAVAWGLPIQQEAIERYALTLADALPRQGFDPDPLVEALRRYGAEAYATLWRAPSAAEASVYGAFPHAADAAHSVFREMAPTFPLAQAAEFLARGQRGGSYWPQASFRRALDGFGVPLAATLALEGRSALGAALKRRRG